MTDRGAAPPHVVDLADPRAVDPALTGAKAANLARCAGHGLPTLPGFVITTAGTAVLDDPNDDDNAPDTALLDEVRAAWSGLVGEEGRTVIVRSSSTAEDLTRSSMAGQFVTVLDVDGWDHFLHAAREVAASARRVLDDDGAPRPMAVLVQPQLDLAVGGVLFGVDPVTGDRDHVVVEVVPARVDDLVSGAVTAAHYVLSPHGRIVESARTDAAPPLHRSLRRRLARLATDAAAALGPAQDVEWALDRDDRLWLLQSRPVTAIAEPAASPQVFGPGPVAETFPVPLRTLEIELWVEPLRDGIARALRATGAVAEHELTASPILVVVGGHVAIDLELTGIASGEPTLRQRYGPAGILRRLAASWRVGRLRVALPRLAADVVATVDADLSAIPPLDQLSADVVVDLIERARRELATVHQYEVLAGMLLHAEAHGLPASLVALDALHEARRQGLADREAIARWPVLLALTAPSLAGGVLPAAAPAPTHECHGLDDLDEREALRLRSRWLQELLAVAVRILARRLVDAGTLARPELIGELTLNELHRAVTGGLVPDDLEHRLRRAAGAPLPNRFRLTESGEALPLDVGDHRTSGLPAAAGRAVGTARHRVAPGAPKDGIVLVTAHLDPSLAPLLPSLDALVSETGSALSHLAILARETGIPAVVGVVDARRRFPPGTRLLVDGGVGDVQVVADDDASVTETEVAT